MLAARRCRGAPHSQRRRARRRATIRTHSRPPPTFTACAVTGSSQGACGRRWRRSRGSGGRRRRRRARDHGARRPHAAARKERPRRERLLARRRASRGGRGWDSGAAEDEPPRRRIDRVPPLPAVLGAQQHAPRDLFRSAERPPRPLSAPAARLTASDDARTFGGGERRRSMRSVGRGRPRAHGVANGASVAWAPGRARWAAKRFGVLAGSGTRSPRRHRRAVASLWRQAHRAGPSGRPARPVEPSALTPAATPRGRIKPSRCPRRSTRSEVAHREPGVAAPSNHARRGRWPIAAPRRDDLAAPSLPSTSDATAAGVGSAAARARAGSSHGWRARKCAVSPVAEPRPDGGGTLDLVRGVRSRPVDVDVLVEFAVGEERLPDENWTRPTRDPASWPRRTRGGRRRLRCAR